MRPQRRTQRLTPTTTTRLRTRDRLTLTRQRIHTHTIAAAATRTTLLLPHHNPRDIQLIIKFHTVLDVETPAGNVLRNQVPPRFLIHPRLLRFHHQHFGHGYGEIGR